MLKGSLQTVALPEVLKFLADTGKSGEFHVAGSHGEGRLWFDEGRISGILVSRAQEASEAIFELLRIDDGEFDFATDAERSDDARGVDGDSGVVAPALEAAQAKLAEWREIVAVVPSLAHRLQLRAETPAAPVTLEPEQWMLVVAVGAGRSVAEVIDARGMQEFDGSKAVRALVEASLVEVREPEAEVLEPEAEVVAEEPVVADEPFAAGALVFEAPAAAGEPAAEEPVASDEVFAETQAFGAAAFEPVEPAGSVDSFDSVDSVDSVEETDAADDAVPGSVLHFGVTESHETWDVEAQSQPVESAPVHGDSGFGAYSLAANPAEGSAAVDETDHYAALRAAMVEIGDDLTTEDGMAGDEQSAHPIYEFHSSPEMDGRAALQALLSEVAEDSESHQGVADEALDGLADRGPWTQHELATMDADTWTEGGDEASNIVPFAPVHAPEGGAVDSADGEESTETQEAAPAEEPINRGLLLKFLSSVRN